MRMLTVILAGLLSSAANAIPVTYLFIGEFTEADALVYEPGKPFTRYDDPTAPLIVDGVTLLDGRTLMTGSITFDHEIINDAYAPPVYAGQVLGWSVQFGGLYFNAQRSGFGHTTYSPGEVYMSDELPIGSSGLVPDVGYLTFNFDPSAFADSLPGELPVESFIGGWFRMSGIEGSPIAANPERLMATFGGTITNLWRVTEVPEPGTLGLLAVGLAGMAITRRRAS